MNDFARLLEIEIPRLRRYARALTRDVSRADDLVQSCLTRAVAKQHLWQPGTDLRAWLFTILRNTYYTNVLRRRREVRDEQGEYAGTLKAAPTQEWSVAMRSLRLGERRACTGAVLVRRLAESGTSRTMQSSAPPTSSPPSTSVSIRRLRRRS